ncbi:TPA: class I SAM-dependent methyltransferase [Legionella pneumophila]|uniref:Uncharacterized methyltransferase ycgJ n=1 Tax=Legionella pneumophila subsp. pascullei TaxID=91890 RepID=A0AAX2IXX0_LEGPN|nr:class I SAM-dependent methyltransferase [Legionella pneumophila]HAT9118062.1 methyltransferase domain-containing protein [Legionella pneumophila subsp. pneumophila]SQG89614.1 Uncharacterized methyltransferase ycgJ [Legionella pneumophila subsp. pascullei]VEH05060.1 Uncharacterized methyltransferase ycgJ [Legionella pneumophila subsp. pascullei]HAT1807252.1 class I SAM-dependent methyltransferase [Legionella pneumophila]HAT1850467.1 class I SAM-dependent methyltransferase [Legionella pneumop
MNTMIWDNKYAAGESLNKYPWDKVVSFIFRYYPRHKKRNEIRVLEVGSGSGCNLWFCAREGFDCYGVDTSMVAVEHAKNWFSRDGLKGEFKQGNFYPLEYQDNFFDLVIDRGSLTCVSKADCEIALKEIYRVLESGGYFCFNPYSDLHTSFKEGITLEDELTEISSGTLTNVGKLKFYNEVEIYDLVQSIGFQIESIKLINEDYFESKSIKHVHAEWFLILRK